MNEKLQICLDCFPDAEFDSIEGCDDCIIGVAERFGGVFILAYDKKKLFEKLTKEGRHIEESDEYYVISDFDETMKLYPELPLLKADGFEDCILGVAQRVGEPYLVAHDRGKMLEKMIKQDKMDYLQADEYYEYNIIGAWVGNETPIYVTKIEDLP